MPKQKVSVINAIKSVLSSGNGGQVDAVTLRNKLFDQGFNVTDINVKLSVLRKKGEILLESGSYKLTREINKSSTKNPKSIDSTEKTTVFHGYDPNSDVAITNRLFKDYSKTHQYEKNGVPLSLMLASIETFKKPKADRASTILVSQNKGLTDYTNSLQLRPSLEKLMVKSALLSTDTSGSNLIKHILKIVKKKSKSKYLKSKFWTGLKLPNRALSRSMGNFLTVDQESNSRSISKTTITKHLLLSACMDEGFDCLLSNYQQNTSKINVKRDQLGYEWSLLFDQNPEQIRKICADYYQAYHNLKQKLKGENNHKDNRIWAKDKNSQQKLSTRIACPYENCETIIDIRTTEAGRWDYFKIHVLSRHMTLLICQCEFCGVFIKQNGQNKKANPRLTMFQHNMTKHLPYDFREWPCSMCDKRFIHSPALRHHAKYEHAGNEFVCFICPSRVFSAYGGVSSWSGLRGHLEKQHEIVSTTRSPTTRGLNNKITRGITLVMFESKKNGPKSKALLKSNGLEVDTEYPENDFAMTYNHDLSAIDKMKTDSLINL